LTPEELVASVKDSVNDLVRRKPAVGWIRGDQALDPEVYRERDELRKEVALLKQRLDNLNVNSIDDLARGEDKIDVDYSFAVNRIKDGQRQDQEEYDATFPFSVSCNDVLSVIKDDLYDTAGEERIKEKIEYWISDLIDLGKLGTKVHSEIKVGPEDTIHVYLADVQKLRFHFEALGLITGVVTGHNDYGRSRRQLCWQLTDKGRNHIANMYAFKKSVKPSAD
jgi:hypothetical protein